MLNFCRGRPPSRACKFGLNHFEMFSSLTEESSKQAVDVNKKNIPFISSNSILYSSCSGIRRKLLIREFQYKITAFENSTLKKNIMKKNKVHVYNTKKQACAMHEQEMAHWLNKRKQNNIFSKLSEQEMKVACNWFQRQMKTYCAGDDKARRVVIENFVKNGFFSSGVEGGRLLARVEFSNNGYLTHQDDFTKFLQQLAKSHSFHEQQFYDIRDFIHTLGGARLAKHMERENKFKSA